MRNFLLVLLIFLNFAVAKAYYHCYTPRCQKTRLEDKIKRLSKKNVKIQDETQKNKIQIEIDEAQAELKDIEQKIQNKS